MRSRLTGLKAQTATALSHRLRLYLASRELLRPLTLDHGQQLAPLQPLRLPSLKPSTFRQFRSKSFQKTMFRSTLSLLERNIAFSLAWLSGVDVLEHAMFSDGAFDVLRAALLSGGVIFADSRSFQQFLPFGAFKHKVIVIAGVLRLRLNSSSGPYNDVLAKISSVLDPSSSVLALGTCQNVVTNALSALRSNAIPAAALAICPLFPTAAALWEDWFDSIALSPTTQVCAIQTTFGGLDVIAITFGVLFHWTPPTPPPALPLTIGAGHETAELQSSQPPKHKPLEVNGATCALGHKFLKKINNNI
ncbi:MAG: hypothetical protein ACTS4T_01795 [Candidatus Hodgkinia cicadicola]